MRAEESRDDRHRRERGLDGPINSPRLPRLPLGPVLRRMKNQEAPEAELARTLRVDSHRVAEWKVKGLHFWAADRVAVALGNHPAVIWGPSWWDLQPLERGRK